MFFSRMVSNLLSSKNSSTSKNGKSGALPNNDNIGTKKSTERSQKGGSIAAGTSSTSALAVFSSPGTSPKHEQKTTKTAKSPKDELPKSKLAPQNKRSRNEKSSFMSLTPKKKTIKKRGISLPINGLESIVDIKNINNLEEPTTSTSTTAFNSVWRPGTLYSDVVSGAGSSTSKKRNELLPDAPAAATPKPPTTAMPAAPVTAPIATNTVSACIKEIVTEPDHHLFPTLSESRKFAGRANQEAQHERGEEEQEQPVAEPLSLADSPTELDFIEISDTGTELSPAVSIAMLSLQFSEMSLDSSSVSASGSMRTAPNVFPEPEADEEFFEFNQVDERQTRPEALVVLADAECTSQISHNTDVATMRECHVPQGSTVNTLPEWNFTPPTACFGFPSGMGMFDDERYLYYERLSWLGLKLAMGDKKW